MATVTFTIPDSWKPRIERELAAGGYASQDDLLQDALAHRLERRETLAALNESIDDMEAGRMRPWEEFDRDFRAEKGIPDERK